MDFLKSAVASAIAKGPAFPYSFGDRVDMDDSIWILYNGTRRVCITMIKHSSVGLVHSNLPQEDGSNCSIFSFDADANKSRLAFARNALKKLRTLRHPGVIKVLDTVESDSHIYIATERLVPLRWHVKRKTLATETIKWGLFSVAQTLKFVNDDASSIHGNVKVASVYTSESGEWKLGGFEVLSSIKDDEAIIYVSGIRPKQPYLGNVHLVTLTTSALHLFTFRHTEAYYPIQRDIPHRNSSAPAGMRSSGAPTPLSILSTTAF